MADVNQLIATFPEQLQQNALRQAQTQNEQLIARQNALKLQQNEAGINALRSVPINPTTGMPQMSGMASVWQASPQTALDTYEALGKIQQQQQQAQVNSAKVIDYWGNVAYDDIYKPFKEYADSLDPNLPNRDQLLQQKLTEIKNRAVAVSGMPDQIVNRFDPFIGNPKSLQTMGPLWESRQGNVAKGWENARIMTGPNGQTYEVNRYNNQARVLGDSSGKTVALPTGSVEATTGGFKSSEAPIFTDASGKQWVRTGPTAFVDRATGQPGTPSGNLTPLSTRPAAVERPMPAPQTAQVQQPDGTWAEAGVYRFPDGRVVDANTNQNIDPSKVRIAKSEPLSGEALDIAATNYLVTGQVPALGWGPQERVRVLNRAGQIAGEYNLSPAQVIGLHAAGRADFAAAVQLGKLRANVSNFEQTANKEADLTLELAEGGIGSKAVQDRLKSMQDDPNAPLELKSLVGTKPVEGTAQSGIPVLNRWIQAGRTNVTGDPDVVAFNAAITSLKNEYARIMSSPGATGGQTSDTARREAEGLINKAQTPEQLKSAIASMKISMQNRIDSIDNEFNSTRKRIENLERPTDRQRNQDQKPQDKFGGHTMDEIASSMKGKTPGKIYPFGDGYGTEIDSNGNITKWKLRPGGNPSNPQDWQQQ